MNKGETKILVTGGSGFIGTNVIDYLLKNNISFLSIDVQTPRKKDHLQFWKKVDILDFTTLNSVINSYKPSYILHLAATTGMGDYDQMHFAPNTTGVENIIKASNNAKSIKHAIFTSTLLVCSRDYFPQHDTDYAPDTQYGESKVKGEEIVRNSQNLNFSWSIIRPTAIWGPWFEHSYKTFFKVIDKGYYFHPSKKPIIKPINYVGNTVHMMLRILLNEDLAAVNKKTFYLADYPEYSIQDWANTIQLQLNGKRLLNHAPLWFLKTIALIGDMVQKIGYMDPPITSFRLNNMLTGSEVPLRNTIELVGDLPYSLDKGVERSIEWLRSIDEIKHK